MALLLAACAADAPHAVLPAAAAVTLGADQVYRPGSAVREFTGGLAGKSPTTQRRKHGEIDASGSWALQIDGRTKSGDWKPVRTVRLVRAADGAVAMSDVRDEKEKNITAFDPPLVLMPARLAAGDTFTASSKVRITRISDGGLVEQGTAESGATLRGHAAGPPATFELESTLRMQLSTAKVLEITLYTVREGEGVVGEHETLNVTIGPLTVRSAEEIWNESGGK